MDESEKSLQKLNIYKIKKTSFKRDSKYKIKEKSVIDLNINKKIILKKKKATPSCLDDFVTVCASRPFFFLCIYGEQHIIRLI